MAKKFIRRDPTTGNLTEEEIPAGGLSRYEIFDDETVEVPAGHNFLLVNDLKLDGELRVDGRIVEVSI